MDTTKDEFNAAIELIMIQGSDADFEKLQGFANLADPSGKLSDDLMLARMFHRNPEFREAVTAIVKSEIGA